MKKKTPGFEKKLNPSVKSSYLSFGTTKLKIWPTEKIEKNDFKILQNNWPLENLGEIPNSIIP